MSRSTVDLQAVRFFLGYGLVFMAQSALTIVIAAGVMLAVNVDLALVSLAPMPLVIWVASRYRRRNRPASQEVQQRIAELTAEAEENVSGIRVVKAFAREQRQLARFNHAVRRVFDQSMVSARLRAFLQPADRLPLPSSGSRVCCSWVDGRRSPGRSASATSWPSTATCSCSPRPMRMLGIALGMAQRAVASGARVFEVLDREPRVVAMRRIPAPLPEGGGRVGSAT